MERGGGIFVQQMGRHTGYRVCVITFGERGRESVEEKRRDNNRIGDMVKRCGRA